MTDRVRKDFYKLMDKICLEKWIQQKDSKYEFYSRGWFRSMPESMKWGVYVDYYRENKLLVRVVYEPVLDMFYFVIIERDKVDGSHGDYHVHENTQCDMLYFSSELEARIQALREANQIRHKQLSDGEK